MSHDSQLRVLIKLALIDNNLADPEKQMIHWVGKAHGITKEDVDDLIEEYLINKNETPIKLPFLTDDEKFEYLYNIVQLMKIDKEVYLSEIRFCEDMATRLGFDAAVISKLSSNIYSDPSITSDRESLKKVVLTYLS